CYLNSFGPTSERLVFVSLMASSEKKQTTARSFGLGIVDQPAKIDSLGFKPYVDGIVAFLIDQRTEAPLTLSVEGEWGAGKSSFMLQLAARLKRTHKLTVSFNAWRHDKEEALWAAFALKFVRDLSAQIGFHRRLAAKFKLRWCRYNWEEGWVKFALFIMG